MKKYCFGGLDMIQPNAIEPTKMPRTALIGVVRNKNSGLLNAAPYSGGLTSLSPLHILFGVKGSHAIEDYRDALEFSISVPHKGQVEQIWRMAMEVPHGINEIEIAGWTESQSLAISTPGIAECALTLECRKAAYFKLPHPWRAIIIGEVLGVRMDSVLAELPRAQAANLLPIHESGSDPDTGLYSPSFLSGDLIPGEPIAHPVDGSMLSGDMLYFTTAELSRAENSSALANTVFPRPTYVLMTTARDGSPVAEVISGGSLQSNEPAVQIPLSRSSPAYANIRRSGTFVVSIPDRTGIERLERLEANPTDIAGAGYNLLPPNRVKEHGLAECPVSIDCKMVILEDVPGTDYALLVGRKVGVTLNEEIGARLDLDRFTLRERLNFINNLYASYLYSVMAPSSSGGLVRRWGFHDPKMVSVPELPSWGSRYCGGWWGPGNSLDFWLIELCQEGLITLREYHKISHALHMWGDGNGISYLSEFFTPDVKEELRLRLTRLLHMMAWAHRDRDKWELVQRFLSTFPEQPRDHHSGPVEFRSWTERI